MSKSALLLSTKLNIPRVRTSLVARPQLIKRLQEEHALTLISTPPGFGKTTLLIEWLTQRNSKAAWLSLDVDDNDPARFVAYVEAALDLARLNDGSDASDYLSAQTPDIKTVISLWINALNKVQHEVVLILDDYHVIQSQSVHDMITFLLEHRPPHLRLCITTRADPPLPLSKLRAQGELLEIRSSQLRFSLSETASFLEIVMGLHLTPELVTILNTRTEGWVTGLQLAALSMRGRNDIDRFVSAFAGSNAYIVDYLADEVLHRQPQYVELFLLHTAFLDQLSGSLCDAVTEQSGSAAILKKLAHDNVFIVALDAERVWYRYHNLFRDVLLQRLKMLVGDLSALYRRASAWYELNGFVIESVNFALAAHDFERAADLIEASASLIQRIGHIHQALAWFTALPETLVHSRPSLCVIHAGLLALASQFESAESYLQHAERRLADTTGIGADSLSTTVTRGHIAAIRAEIARSQGDFTQCVHLARLAFELLPESEKGMRERLRMYLLLDFLQTGIVTREVDRQQAQLAEAAHASENRLSYINGMTTLGWIRLYRGELHKAAATFELAMKSWELVGIQDVAMTLYCRLGFAEILYEWGRFEESRVYLLQGLTAIYNSSKPDVSLVWLVARLLIRFEYAQGDLPAADNTLTELIEIAQNHRLGSYLDMRLTALRVWLRLAQRQVAVAGDLISKCNLSVDSVGAVYFQREFEYLTLARLWILQETTGPTTTGNYDVLALLDRMLLAAETGFRTKSVIAILVLRALALHTQHKTQVATSDLLHALRLSEPEQYQRVFVDEGTTMQALLADLTIDNSKLRDYRDQLLRAFPVGHVAVSTEETQISPHTLPNPLIEPLSQREIEVLHCIHDGLSNREIAEHFVVAPSTVKWYINNLYSKLGASSRTQALARARELRLL